MIDDHRLYSTACRYTFRSLAIETRTRIMLQERIFHFAMPSWEMGGDISSSDIPNFNAPTSQLIAHPLAASHAAYQPQC